MAVESAVGEGSRFSVWLPLRTPEDGALAPVVAAPPRATAVDALDASAAEAVEDVSVG